jgi:hypothetical protein
MALGTLVDGMGAQLRLSERLAWFASAMLSVALVVVSGEGEVSAALGVAVGLGLTVWSAIRMRRLRKAEAAGE